MMHDWMGFSFLDFFYFKFPINSSWDCFCDLADHTKLLLLLGTAVSKAFEEAPEQYSLIQWHSIIQEQLLYVQAPKSSLPVPLITMRQGLHSFLYPYPAEYFSTFLDTLSNLLYTPTPAGQESMLTFSWQQTISPRQHNMRFIPSPQLPL